MFKNNEPAVGMMMKSEWMRVPRKYLTLAQESAPDAVVHKSVRKGTSMSRFSKISKHARKYMVTKFGPAHDYKGMPLFLGHLPSCLSTSLRDM